MLFVLKVLCILKIKTKFSNSSKWHLNFYTLNYSIINDSINKKTKYKEVKVQTLMKNGFIFTDELI